MPPDNQCSRGNKTDPIGGLVLLPSVVVFVVSPGDVRKRL